MEFPLSQWRKENRSPIGYNYYNLINKHLPFKLEKSERDSPLIVRYINHSILKDEEYRYVEFKEVKGNNPTDSILSLVDQYVVAYLNENSNHRGRIFWGITDEERKVVGVKLNYKQRDELRKRISERLGQIQPSLPPSVYRINVEKVYDTKLSEIADLCIIEISVEPYQNIYLYSTSKGEVYIKTDGGKKKLSSLELQQEILLRRKN
ncbi:ATP-binding protein [Paenibacillus sp. MAHUQ-46]|uniref:ATP-binding protein n=2 Tax=Paenibacillus TaxID=44249 RepID=A0A934MPV6_9BACL|nr:ATP-binding protein [Paenibacillus roseus]